MMSQRIYVDVHIIQTVPPSCVNRDDTGSPKTAVYGGVTRARVSSQAWKKAVRGVFSDVFPKDELGVRTLRIVKMVADEIRLLDSNISEEAAQKLAQKWLEAAKIKLEESKSKNDDKELKSKALFFMSVSQAKALAALAVENGSPDKKAAQAALSNLPSIDVALFGRMVADDPSLNTDACAQVAHSISTHRVSNEYDYFTAMDDLSPEDSAGAGMIGTVEFNSSTLYRYATVAVHALHENLGNDAAAAVKEFIRAFALSMPTGKQNTFANRTVPDCILVTLRTDQPINMVGAFERPVCIKQNEGGYAKDSISSLAKYAGSVYESFAKAPELALVTSVEPSALGESIPLEQLLEKVETAVADRLQKNGGAQ